MQLLIPWDWAGGSDSAFLTNSHVTGNAPVRDGRYSQENRLRGQWCWLRSEGPRECKNNKQTNKVSLGPVAGWGPEVDSF